MLCARVHLCMHEVRCGMLWLLYKVMYKLQHLIVVYVHNFFHQCNYHLPCMNSGIAIYMWAYPDMCPVSFWWNFNTVLTVIFHIVFFTTLSIVSGIWFMCAMICYMQCMITSWRAWSAATGIVKHSFGAPRQRESTRTSGTPVSLQICTFCWRAHLS